MTYNYKKKIMKNVVYYSTLFFAWLVIHLLLAATLIIIGTIEGPYALGVAAIIPEVWILSVGLAMFTRKALAKRILHKEKSFSKAIPIVLVALGGVMVGSNIVLKIVQKNSAVTTTLVHAPKETESSAITASHGSENAENSKDMQLSKNIRDFKSALNKKFEKMSKNTPISLDEITTLQKIELSESSYTLIFQLNIDKNDFEGYYLEQIVEDFVEEKKNEFYYDAVFKCAMAEVDSNEFFKAANIKIEYTFTDTNNSHIRTCGFEFKELAKE